MTVTRYATATPVSVDAGRDRFVIGGVDVTHFRGAQTAFPEGLTYTEPFGYGACTFTFERINPCVEKIGVGETHWVREGAGVKIQRADDSGTIIGHDYLGIVAAWRAAGNKLQIDVVGQVTGRLNLLDRQPPTFAMARDMGLWAHDIAVAARVSLSPRFPLTGIKYTNAGGMTELAWAQEVCQMAQTVDGDQWTFMPKVWGQGAAYEFRLKDRTTKHLTLFADGQQIALDLGHDAAESPNVYFGSGTDPDGMRWRNAKYQGLTANVPAPAYPMAGGATFGIGTTDADTIGGDGINTLQWKLHAAGYLNYRDTMATDVVYTDEVGAAVRRMRDDVNLPAGTTMTPAAWDALFDVTRTGYRLIEARVMPLVADKRTQRWLYTADGSLAGHNPDYDPTILEVHRTNDFGDNVTKQRATDYDRGVYSRRTDSNWAGTITLSLGMGGYAGEWGPADVDYLNDPTTGPAHIMPQRDIRPGMNVWLPLFDGGTLLHIAQVAVSADSVTLSVDTQARDALTLDQVIARNADSRRSARREFRSGFRKQPATRATWDEFGGVLAGDVDCPGGQWTVVPVPMGRAGQVNRTDLQVLAATEFCMAVFSEQMTPHRLTRRIGDPFPVNSDDETVWESNSVAQDWADDGTLLYAAGNENQPCGYGARKHKNAAGHVTAAPLTGRHYDTATWSYETPSDEMPVVWLAIYPRNDTTLKAPRYKKGKRRAGQIFYKQDDDASA